MKIERLTKRVNSMIKINEQVIDKVRNDRVRRNGRQAHLELHGEPKD